MRALSLAGAWCALALAATGCVVVVDFEPVGTAASVELSWQVASAPPTAQSCSAAGIATVRAGFFDGDGDTRRVDHGNLIFVCHFPGSPDPGVQGRYPQLDGAGNQPRPRIVARGAWRVGLVAVDGAGSVIARGPVIDVTVADGDHLVLAPVDFILPP